MKKSEWEIKDIDEIISLIIFNNTSAVMEPEYTTRLRGWLKSLGAAGLWDHIWSVYDGILYEPEDDTKPEEDKLLERWRRTERKVAVKDVQVTRVMRDHAHELQTELLGKSYVENVFSCADGIIVLTWDEQRVRRYAKKYHPDVRMEVCVCNQQ